MNEYGKAKKKHFYYTWLDCRSIFLISAANQNTLSALSPRVWNYCYYYWQLHFTEIAVEFKLCVKLCIWKRSIQSYALLTLLLLLLLGWNGIDFLMLWFEYWQLFLCEPWFCTNFMEVNGKWSFVLLLFIKIIV